MKIKCVVVLGILFLAGLVTAEEKTALKDQKEKFSYGIGVDTGQKLQNLPIELDLDLFIKGVKDAFSKSKLLMTDKEIQETMMNLQKELRAKLEEKRKEIGEKNKKEGELFLAENKKKEGVVTLPSGLQYKVLKEGTGEKPKDADTVTVHYRGTLIDGTEFDSSYSRGKPASFPVKGVIPGWTEALKLMREGAKWQLLIPANLAYGERGGGTRIGPNAALIFEVELISIQKAQGTPPKPSSSTPPKPPQAK